MGSRPASRASRTRRPHTLTDYAPGRVDSAMVEEAASLFGKRTSLEGPSTLEETEHYDPIRSHPSGRIADLIGGSKIVVDFSGHTTSILRRHPATDIPRKNHHAPRHQRYGNLVLR